MPDDEFEVFRDENDVEVRTPSLARVLLTLAGAGVLVAIVVIVLASLATAHRPAPDILCGGAPSCTGLSTEQVAELTALELPLDAEVMSSRYESSAEQILVEATVRLPIGSANPFEDGPYFVVDETPLTIPGDLSVFGFYAATGELGALQSDGALVDDGMSEIVIVRVQRTL